jgi:DNA modification methylase
MSTPLLIKRSEIIVRPQPRKQFSNLDELADSIRERGIIQPLVLTEDKVLLCGERRYRAAGIVGLESVPYVLYRDIPEDEREELQLIENIERQSLTWQEEALGLLSIYRKKRLKGNLEGWTYGTKEAARQFKMSIGMVDYVLDVARKLDEEERLQLPMEKRKYWKFTSASEAYRLGLLQEVEDKLLADLAKVQQKAINLPNEKETNTNLPVEIGSEPMLETNHSGVEEGFNAEAKARYEANPHNTMPFEEYCREKEIDKKRDENTIHLSRRIIHGDSIERMNSPEWEGLFDHIITDPPYAIDVEMMEQASHGLVQVDRIRDAHEVEENLTLLQRFFPAAFKCTKERAYVVTFCDPMIFSTLVEYAEGAGFSAQRWPLIWTKVNQSIMNSSAHCNTTKDFEFAMICHKPQGTLAKKRNSSIIPGSNTLAKKLFSHPFSKPFEVVKEIIELVSLPHQRILEPFAGGGSIVFQILKENREVFAVEKEEHHYNSLLENLKREWYLKLNPNFIFK